MQKLNATKEHIIIWSTCYKEVNTFTYCKVLSHSGQDILHILVHFCKA